MRTSIVKISFIATILLLLLIGFFRTFFFPKDVNYYENRYCAKIMPLTKTSFMDSTFQNSLEEALADQIPFAQRSKKYYNDLSAYYDEMMLGNLLASNPDQYINYHGMLIYGSDHLVYKPYVFSDISTRLDERIHNMNRTFEQYNSVEFYVYYIEKDTDINFKSGDLLGTYEYLSENLTLPPNHISHFEVRDFETFQKYFYRTDHHWNHLGSYQGYLDVLSLLGITESPLQPTDTLETTATMTGSKCLETGSSMFHETVSFYTYDWPTMQIRCNGETVTDYGNQSPNAINMDYITYGELYGSDAGELIIQSDNTGKGSLLLIGESYDNAILKLLSCHFDTLYAIDLRNYEAFMGNPFHLSSYLEKHQIDKVLLIGNVDYFISPTFNLES